MSEFGPYSFDQSKEASGISVYLLEELGDARLRCAQLKKYIDEAVNLINKSEYRDHFFEEAAHLIHGIPDTLLRMDKALSAAALGASKLDYEEIKEELRPEKVEELERALDDIRVRRVDRRGGIKTPEVAAQLEHLAASAESGQLDNDRLASLISELDGQVRTAAEGEESVGQVLRSLAGSLLQATNPSRLLLASTLRRVLADSLCTKVAYLSLTPRDRKVIQAFIDRESAESQHLSTDGNKLDGNWMGGKGIAEWGGGDKIYFTDLGSRAAETVQKYIEEEVPRVFIDSETLKTSNPEKTASEDLQVLSRFEEGVPADPTENMSEEDAKKWEEMTEEHRDDFKTAETLDLKTAAKSQIFGISELEELKRSPKADKMAFRSGRTPMNFDVEVRTFLSRDALRDFLKKEHKHWGSLSLGGKVWKALIKDRVPKNMVAYPSFEVEEGREASENFEKESRFEEGKPADPTENMSEEDADKWDEMNEEHRDNFKSASIEWKEVAKNLLDKSKGTTQDSFHYRAYLRAVLMGQPAEHLVEKFQGAKDARQDLIDEAGKAPSWKVAAENLAEMALRSRFEEGVPADPTENMNEEDAEEWDRQKEEHKDEFKAASVWKVSTYSEPEVEMIQELKNRSTISFEEAKRRFELFKDCLAISSGTLSTLTGYKRYDDLDMVQEDFTEFVKSLLSQRNWKNWQQAWREFDHGQFPKDNS